MRSIKNHSGPQPPAGGQLWWTVFVAMVVIFMAVLEASDPNGVLQADAGGSRDSRIYPWERPSPEFPADASRAPGNAR